jgi:hypothetical protein
LVNGFPGHTVPFHISHCVHDGVKEDLCEGDEQVEDEPDVNQLDIGRLREGVGHTDEEGHKHEKGRQIDSHNGFKVLSL